jgi:hypothetical protein
MLALAIANPAGRHEFWSHLLQETLTNMVESDGMVFSGLKDEYWYDWMLSDVLANGNVDDR